MMQQEEFTGNDDTLSPSLEALRGVVPYAVPDQYFNGLPERLAAICMDDEAMLTAGLPKGNPFSVPEGYFDTAHLGSSKKKNSTKRISLRRYATLAAAALLLLFAGIGYYHWNQSQAASPEAAIASLDPDSIQAYVQENIDDFDETMLAENTVTAAVDLNDLSDEDIKAYLDNEDGISSKTN